jgi:Tfp pilus assembly PilM family ATPase
MARLISIDLGAHAVKVTVFTGGTQGHTLEDEVIRKVPQDGTTTPSIADRIASLDLLLREHTEWKDAHITEVSWSSDRTSVRRLKLPFSDDAQIAQTLPFALESDVPFDLDDMLLAWRPNGEPGDVLAVLTAKEPVSDLMDALEHRRLDPRRLVPDGELLARYATYSDVVTAVVDIGHAHTVVTLARGGRALWFRSIDVAGRSFTRAIQAALTCTWAEAEAIKHGEHQSEESQTQPAVRIEELPVGPPAQPQAVRDAIHGVAGLLLAEIRSTLVQAEDEFGVEVDEVVLCGGGSRLPELQRWMSEDLGLPVKAPTLDGHANIVPEMALARALVADLADPSDAKRLDLRVGDLTFQGGITAPATVFRYGGALLGSFLVAVITLFFLQYRQIGQEQELVDARIHEVVASTGLEIDETTESNKAVTALAELVMNMDEEAAFLPTPGRAPPIVHELFKISKAMPPHPDVTLDVDRLEITNGAILINGVTDGFSQVDSIGESLKSAGNYNNVTATPGNRDNKGKLQFTVNIDRSAEDDEPKDGEKPEEPAKEEEGG